MRFFYFYGDIMRQTINSSGSEYFLLIVHVCLEKLNKKT